MNRPRPKLDSINTPFWVGGAEGRLNIQKCSDCGKFTHPPLPLCRHCQSENVAPEAVPGSGVIDSFTVNHQVWAPGMAVPFVIAWVKLDAAPGVALTSNIVNCGPDQVRCGDRVRVVFTEQEGIFFPLFEKAG